MLWFGIGNSAKTLLNYRDLACLPRAILVENSEPKGALQFW